VVPGPGAGSATAPFARAEPEPRLVTAVRYRLRLAVAAAARQAGQRWGRLRPLGLDAPATPLGRRPGREGAPAVIGLVAARRQRRRRARIPPNSNTRTTTMISTHNHVDMAASLVGAGAGQADTTAAHPGKQLPASRRPPGPGSTAALRAGSRSPCTPATCPSIWLAGRVPGRPRIGPGGAKPAQPNPIDQHHTRGRPGRRQPTRRDHSEADRRRVWRGREEFALLGWGNNPSMVVLRRNGRRRAAGAEPMVRAFGETRTCAEDGCTARLSRYNPARCCAIHQGWDQQEVTRRRRRRP
jgi:hypothetical protein